MLPHPTADPSPALACPLASVAVPLLTQACNTGCGCSGTLAPGHCQLAHMGEA